MAGSPLIKFIHIPEGNCNTNYPIKLSLSAYLALLRVSAGTNMSLDDLASEIIYQAVDCDLIRYDS